MFLSVLLELLETWHLLTAGVLGKGKNFRSSRVIGDLASADRRGAGEGQELGFVASWKKG